MARGSADQQSSTTRLRDMEETRVSVRLWGIDYSIVVLLSLLVSLMTFLDTAIPGEKYSGTDGIEIVKTDTVILATKSDPMVIVLLLSHHIRCM